MPTVEAYSRLAGVYDEIVVDACHGRWADFLDELWQADGAAVRAVLDVCCGTGLMTQQLVTRGYRVVGMDSSTAMLVRARELLGPSTVLMRQTLPDLDVEGTFDAAVSTFDGLNYLTVSDLRASLAAISRRVRVGGWLVFDLHTDAMMDFTTSHPVVSGNSDGYQFIIGNAVDVDARSCDTTIDLTRTSDGDTFTEHHRQYFFTDEQVRSALGAAGFGQVTVTDEYSLEPATSSTLRATWIARRTLARTPAEPTEELIPLASLADGGR